MIRSPMKYDDYRQLTLQTWQSHEVLTREAAENVVRIGHSWAYFDKDAKCRAVGGLVEAGDSFAAWSYIDAHSAPSFPGIVRHMKRVLAGSKKPVDAYCVTGFDAGARLLSMLGFRWRGETSWNGTLYRVFRYEVGNGRA